MKKKYFLRNQSDSCREIVAGSLAAAYCTGAFSSYTGVAMLDIGAKPKTLWNSCIEISDGLCTDDKDKKGGEIALISRINVDFEVRRMIYKLWDQEKVAYCKLKNGKIEFLVDSYKGKENCGFLLVSIKEKNMMKFLGLF